MLEIIGSMIGNPICLDGVTASNAMHGYARVLAGVLVEEAKRTEAILLSPPGEEFEVLVEFEWLSWSCSDCKCFGHMVVFCQKKT